MSWIKSLTCVYSIFACESSFSLFENSTSTVLEGYSQNAQGNSPNRGHSNGIAGEVTAELFRPEHVFLSLGNPKSTRTLPLVTLLSRVFVFSFLIFWFLFIGFGQVRYTSQSVHSYLMAWLLSPGPEKEIMDH